jgi:hypothetical protein
MDKVIFRKFKEGDVIALLPNNEVNRGMVESYQHIGQHGEATIDIINYTTLAKPAEYKDLLAELKSIGYNPKIYKRLQYGWLNWQRK